MKILINDMMPCWYEISWCEDPQGILLRIHEEFLKELKAIPIEHSIIQRFIAEFKFAEFAGSLKEDFGFNKALTHKGLRGDFVEFLARLPEIKEDWAPVYALSASLRMFFTLAEYPQKETTHPLPQLLTIGLSTERDYHGGSIGGSLVFPYVDG